MAELGTTNTLADEIRAAIAADTAEQVFIGDGFSSPKAITMEFTVGRDFPLLTLVTMVVMLKAADKKLLKDCSLDDLVNDFERLRPRRFPLFD